MFLPPTSVSWPGKTDHVFSWNATYFPTPTFGDSFNHRLASVVIESLYQVQPTKRIDYLLGLGAVSEVIFPHYNDFGSYIPFMETADNYKIFIHNNITRTKNLVLQKSKYPSIDIYKNLSFIPHFFVPKNIVYIYGESKELPAVVTAEDELLTAYLVEPLQSIKHPSKIPQLQSKINSIYIFPKKQELTKRSLVYWNQDWPWPEINIHPNTLLYRLMRFKETIDEKLAKNTIKKIDKKLWHAAKRVAEADTYKLQKKLVT